MRNYLDLMKKILDEGTLVNNRTGVDTIRLETANLTFDLQKGFPLVTTRKIFTTGIIGELIGFIRGYTNNADFKKLGCNLWSANANSNQQWLDNPNRKGTDDLGPIYGAQWRRWKSGDGFVIDQLRTAIETIINNPSSRRIIVTAWNPGELHKMALPPCHYTFQILTYPETKELSLVMSQRSCDYAIGIPSNIASYALLLEIIAAATGYKAKNLNMQLTDVHIYVNHIDKVKEQLKREPQALPTLSISLINTLTGIDFIDGISQANIEVLDYNPLPAIHYPFLV